MDLDCGCSHHVDQCAPLVVGARDDHVLVSWHALEVRGAVGADDVHGAPHEDCHTQAEVVAEAAQGVVVAVADTCHVPLIFHVPFCHEVVDHRNRDRHDKDSSRTVHRNGFQMGSAHTGPDLGFRELALDDRNAWQGMMRTRTSRVDEREAAEEKRCVVVLPEALPRRTQAAHPGMSCRGRGQRSTASQTETPARPSA